MSEQEILANAHETRDAGCLGLSAVISTKSRFLNERRSIKSSKNSLKPSLLNF